MIINRDIRKRQPQSADLRYDLSSQTRQFCLWIRQKKTALKSLFLISLIMTGTLTACSSQSDALIIRDYSNSAAGMPTAPPSEEERLKQLAVDTLNRYFGLELTAEGWELDVSYSSGLRTEISEYAMVEERETMLVLFLCQKNSDDVSYGVCIVEKTQEVLAAQINFEPGQPIETSPQTELQILNHAKTWFENNRPEFDRQSMTGIVAVQMKNQIALSIVIDDEGHKGYLYTSLTDGRPLAFGIGSFAEYLLMSADNLKIQYQGE